MVIFVGDKPSSKMKPGAKPFEGAACEARLKSWIKAVVPSYLPSEIINSNTTKDISNITDLYIRFKDIKGMKPKFIALGNNASRALTMCKIPHFKLPHPSGRNRQINNKNFINNKLNECAEWLK